MDDDGGSGLVAIEEFQLRAWYWRMAEEGMADSLSATSSKTARQTADLLKHKGFPDDRRYTTSVHSWSSRGELRRSVRVRVRQAPQERDKGFDGEEAGTILSATLRKPSDKISVEMAAARRWVPWICAYTGARVNEITPLTGRDFVRSSGLSLEH
jgi:hypothetical protein